MRKFLFIGLLTFIFTLSNAVYKKIGHSELYFHQMELFGNYIVGVDQNQFTVLDISNPASIETISTFELPYSCYQFKIKDSILFVNCRDNGLFIYNLELIYQPEFISHFETASLIKSIDVGDSFVCLAMEFNGLKILDVSDLANPFVTASLTDFYADSVHLFDSFGIVLSLYNNARIIDFTEPEEPQIISEYFSLTEHLIQDIIIHGSILYLAQGSFGITAYDLRNLEDIVLLFESSQPAGKIIFNDGKAYVFYNFVKIFETNDFSEEFLIGSLGFQHHVKDVVVADDICYCTDHYTNFNFYELADPTNPDLNGSCDTPGSAVDIAVYDNYIYVADYESQVQIIDITNPTDPFITNSFGLYYPIHGISIDNEKAYAISNTRLYKLNLTDPEHPDLVSYLNTGYMNRALYSQDGLVFLVSGSRGLKIVDFEDSYEPEILLDYDISEYSTDVFYKDGIVYLADCDGGLKLIDISDMSQPEEISYFNDMQYVRSIYNFENFLFLSCGYDGFKILDISDSKNPVLVFDYNDHEDSRFLTRPIIMNNYLMIEDRNWNTIHLFDISEPANPIFLNKYEWNLCSPAFAQSGDFLITANKSFGISVFSPFDMVPVQEDIIYPETDFSLSCSPNPFSISQSRSSSISFSFSLQEDSMIRLDVYNLKGQKVRSIANKDMSAGVHNISWNGTDDNEKPVSSGVYLYRLETQSKSKTQKMLLLK